jgi:predicted DNA-binding transcriptional regulator YafY
MSSKTTTGNQRSAVARLIQVLRLLVTGRHTAGSIAARLEVAEKTVLRDIEFFQDRVGLEVRFDAATRTWTVTGYNGREALANAGALTVIAGGAR